MPNSSQPFSPLLRDTTYRWKLSYQLSIAVPKSFFRPPGEFQLNGINSAVGETEDSELHILAEEKPIRCPC